MTLCTKVMSEVELIVTDAGENDHKYPMGFGKYHSFVHVHGVVIDYEGARRYGGIKTQESIPPRWPKTRIVVDIGRTKLSLAQVQQLVDDLKIGDWTAERYHYLTHNCNHCADLLCRLLCGSNIPGWVNRTPKLLAFEMLTPRWSRNGHYIGLIAAKTAWVDLGQLLFVLLLCTMAWVILNRQESPSPRLQKAMIAVCLMATVFCTSVLVMIPLVWQWDTYINIVGTLKVLSSLIAITIAIVLVLLVSGKKLPDKTPLALTIFCVPVVLIHLYSIIANAVILS